MTPALFPIEGSLKAPFFSAITTLQITIKQLLIRIYINPIVNPKLVTYKINFIPAKPNIRPVKINFMPAKINP